MRPVIITTPRQLAKAHGEQPAPCGQTYSGFGRSGIDSPVGTVFGIWRSGDYFWLDTAGGRRLVGGDQPMRIYD